MAGKKAARREQGPRPVNGRIDFAGLYGAAAVMGFTPRQVNELSPWQWAAAAEGYAEAHRSPDDKAAIGLSDEEFEIASKMLDT